MSDSDEIMEGLLVKAMEKLKSRAKEAVDDVMGDLYVEYLPHVLADTEMNVKTLVDDVVRNLVAGRFEKCMDGTYVRVPDSRGHIYLISLGEYSHLVRPLCELMKDVIASSRIAQLEHELESLREEIRRHHYP